MRLLRPEGRRGALPAVLYIHGAGWVFGSKHTHDRLIRELCAGTGAVVVFPSYDLSPGARYPRAIEENYAVLAWLADHGAEGDIDASRIAVAGDCVGGNMAAAITLMAKERSGPKLAAQLLFYPVTDASFGTASYREFAEGYYLRRDGMQWLWDQYSRSDDERGQITASPLRATLEQLSGLPPALVITGEADVLRDEGEAYAKQTAPGGHQGDRRPVPGDHPRLRDAQRPARHVRRGGRDRAGQHVSTDSARTAFVNERREVTQVTEMTQTDIRTLLRSSAREAAGAPLPEEARQFAASVERATPQGLELRHLRYFVAVADAGTFTLAAEQMFIAQPTLSQQIRRLEEMVGTPLLRRRREGVQLTAAGTVFLEESRTALSLVEHAVRMTRTVAGLGRPLLRVAIPPGMPDALAAVTATRLQRRATDAGVDVAWLETSLDGNFSLIQQHRADAALGWVTGNQAVLPDRLDVMTLGEFEPEAWIPSSHPGRTAAPDQPWPAGRPGGGPRAATRASAGTYDSWLAILRSADPRFVFADPPFEQPLLMTLAFAAAASRPTAVLTGPRYPAGARSLAREDRAANAYGMVPVRLDQSPLTANASLVCARRLAPAAAAGHLRHRRGHNPATPRLRHDARCISG